MADEPSGVSLTPDEQQELLARSRRTETMLYKLMLKLGVPPRQEDGEKTVNGTGASHGKDD